MPFDTGMTASRGLRLGVLGVCLLAPALLHAEVRIHGVNRALTQQILTDLSIAQTESQHTALSLDAIEAQHRRATAEIRSTLESQGYYSAQVSSELFLPDFNSDEWLARYTVQLGAPTRIHTVRIQITGPGKDNPTLQALLKQAPFTRGAVLSHKLYEQYKEKLLSRALQLGYLDALMVQSLVAIDRTQHQADITLHLETQAAYRFGTITFPDAPYPPEFLMQYLPHAPGESYTTSRLLDIHRSFAASDLFQKVRITPELKQRDRHEVPLQIGLENKPKNSYLTSLGYGTDTGPRGRLGWERRRPLHPGHRILAQTEVSRWLRQAGLQYRIPGQRPATDTIALGTQVTEEFSRDDKYSRRYDVSVQDVRKRQQLEFLSGLRYTGEVFRELPTEPKRSSHFLLPNMSIVWKQTHKELEKEYDRQYGLRLQGTVRGALGLLLSSTSLFQVEVKGKWIHLLGDNSRLLLRADVGSTLAAEPEEVPLSLRYFTGGDHTVRGYAYKSLGPVKQDKNGQAVVVGGRYLLVMSSEFETRIYKQVSGAVFMDAGNAMNEWRERLALSAGFGIRYATPIGLLRIDIAKPIEHGKTKPRLHLTFSMDL